MEHPCEECTDLIQAAWKGHDECVEVLLQGECDVNAVTNNGNTALICAAKKGYYKCVNLLLEAGADVNVSSREGSTALMEATSCGSEECIKLILATGADVNATLDNGTSVLIKAASFGNDKCLKLLLEAGADVNATDKVGLTALIMAAMNGHDKCVGQLLQAKANAQAQAQEGSRWSWFQRAAKLKDVHKYVMGAKFVPKWLRSSHSSSHDTPMKGYVNAISSFGCTALIGAAESGSARSAELLIMAGADVNLCTYFRGTALSRAAYYGKINCIGVLLQAGADMSLFCQTQPSHSNLGISDAWEVENDGRLTALNSAVKNGQYECTETLIKLGADVNLTDGYGDTALMRAVKSECAIPVVTKCIQVLLKAGCQINKTNFHGQNALKYYIAEKKSPDQKVSMLLLAAGETLGGTTSGKFVWLRSLSLKRRVKVPEFLQQTKLKFKLKNLCREEIRKHLLKLDAQSHLFDRVPQLNLPSSLTEYLLFNMSLE